MGSTDGVSALIPPGRSTDRKSGEPRHAAGYRAAVPSAEHLLAFLVAGVVLVAVPGPSVLFIVGRALAHGRRAALTSVAGNTTGVVLIVLAVALGIGAVAAASVAVFAALKLAGAAYLVYLGVQTWRHRGDLAVAVGTYHRVGGVGQVAGPGAEQVGGGLAAGAQPTGLVVGEHVLLPEEFPQVPEQGRRDRGGGQVGPVDGGPVLEAERLLDQTPGGVWQRRGGSRVAPAARVHLGLSAFAHVLQCDT